MYESISDIVRPYLPASLANVSVDITKIVTVEEFVKTAVVKFLKDKHHIACAGIEEKDVSVKLGNPVLVNLSLETTVYEFFIETVRLRRQRALKLLTSIKFAIYVKVKTAGEKSVFS